MSPVTTRLEGRTAILQMDDGRANALNPAMIEALTLALDDAKGTADSVVLTGREGKLCAGFDLKIMMSGPAAAMELVKMGCDFLLTLYEHPQPVVAACTGHALAGGALLLLCSDYRVGLEGEFKIALNEVRIGMPLPVFASELARERLDPRAFVQATLNAHVFDPESAAQVGWFDELASADSLLDKATAAAVELASLPATAYASTKRSLRAPLISHVRATYEDDLARVTNDMRRG